MVNLEFVGGKNICATVWTSDNDLFLLVSFLKKDLPQSTLFEHNGWTIRGDCNGRNYRRCASVKVISFGDIKDQLTYTIRLGYGARFFTEVVDLLKKFNSDYDALDKVYNACRN